MAADTDADADAGARPRAVDLFCGCGGLSLGAGWAGLDVRCGVELDPRVVGLYRANFEHEVLQRDVAAPGVAAALAAHRPDVVLGSPPCTDFSPCGACVESDRAALTVRFGELVRELAPRAFLMENVPALLHSRAFAEMSAAMAAAGWTLATAVLNAAWLGVPQSRKRVFVVGSRDPAVAGRFAALVRAELRAGLKANSTAVCEVLPHAGEHIWAPPRNNFCPGVLPTGRPYPTMRANAGRGLLGPPARYNPRNGDSAPVERAYVVRTAEEGAALASFPASYRWTTPQLAGHAIGNCVPPKMAEFACRLLCRALAGEGPEPPAEGPLIHATPGRRRIQVRSYLGRWAAPPAAGPPPAGAAALSAAAALGAEVGAADGGGRYLVRYRYGTRAAGDAASDRMLGWQLRPGWTLVLQERGTKDSKEDDVFLEVPGFPIWFRGRAGLERRGLLPAPAAAPEPEPKPAAAAKRKRRSEA